MDERDEKIDKLSTENLMLHEELAQARATMQAMADELEDSVTLMKAAVERAEEAERKRDVYSHVLGNAFRYSGNVAALPPQQVEVEIDKGLSQISWPVDRESNSILYILQSHYSLNLNDYKQQLHMRLRLGESEYVYAVSLHALIHMPAPQLAQYLRESLAPTIAAKFAGVLKQRYGR